MCALACNWKSVDLASQITPAETATQTKTRTSSIFFDFNTILIKSVALIAVEYQASEAFGMNV